MIWEFISTMLFTFIIILFPVLIVAMNILILGGIIVIIAAFVDNYKRRKNELEPQKRGFLAGILMIAVPPLFILLLTHILHNLTA